MLHIMLDNGYIGHGFCWNRQPRGQLASTLIGADLLKGILVYKLVNCRSFHVDCPDEAEQLLNTHCLLPNDVLGIILSIVVQSGIAVRSLKMQSTSTGDFSAGILETRRLSRLICPQNNFRTGWAHLSKLELRCQIIPDQYNWLRDVLRSAPRLQQLS